MKKYKERMQNTLMEKKRGREERKGKNKKTQKILY